MWPVALVYGEDSLAYDFGPGHPLRPLRVRLAVELMEDAGLVRAPHVRRVLPREAAEHELTRVHDPAYVDAVRQLCLDPWRRDLAGPFGFLSPDNPCFPGMHRAAALIAGGSLAAADLILRDEIRRAFHPAGGLHHAMRARAGGFCIYNDAACAIARFLDAGLRVLYVDGDAHHGDGVQALFYEDPRVLTISLHQDPRSLFPGTGFVSERGSGPGLGYAVNVPLLPGTDDASWIEAFETVVPPLARAFRPNVIVSQHGCDAHALDPLADLAVTTRALEHFARALDALSRELCDGRWLALGGGGYDVWRVVPRAWTLTWAAVSGQDAPDAVPPAWRARRQPEAPVMLPERMRDAAGPEAPDAVREANRAAARAAAGGALDQIRDGPGR